MQVGVFAGNTFDIYGYDETQTVLQKRHYRNTLLFKDEEQRLHVLDRTITPPTTLLAGTQLKAYYNGLLATTETGNVVATLLVDFDPSLFQSKVVTLTNGEQKVAYLVPVKL